MKKARFLFLILALVLVVGMTTGLIVRKQTGGQTVMQHSGVSAPVSTTPATTGDDEPAAPEPEVFKIPVLISDSLSNCITVIENGVEVDPIDVFEYRESSYFESKVGDFDDRGGSYSVTYLRYLVDPTCSSVEFDHNLRPGDPWCDIFEVLIDYSDTSCFTCYSESTINTSTYSQDLSNRLFYVVY